MAAAGDDPETCTVDVASTAVRRCWSSTFPDDLLAVICRTLVSRRDRASFVAVCRSWRAAARAAPPQELPWLLLSPWQRDKTKRLYCPEDGTVVRVNLSGEREVVDCQGACWDANLMRVKIPDERELVGCHGGGWVATFKPASLQIKNISSGAKVKLGKKQERLVCGDHILDSFLKIYAFSKIPKIVFSEPPTSPDCIIAAIIHHDRIGHRVGLCRIGCPNSGWTVHRCQATKFVDITFCSNSELYALTENGSELVKFEIGLNEDGAPVVMAQRQLAMKSIDDPTISLRSSQSQENLSYIFDLHGKLAMARKAQWSPNLEPVFKVFELVDIHANQLYTHKWVEVVSLGDHALFLGRTFSTAVHVPANRRGDVERNSIYFPHDHYYGSPYGFVPRHYSWQTSYENDGQTYYKENERRGVIKGDEVKRIRSVGYYMREINSNYAAWILPPDI